MRTIQRNIVSAVILSKDNKILFGKKDPKKGGVYKDGWHIPGGGVDEGEEHLDALSREINEETGLEVDDSQISLLDDLGSGATEKTLKETSEVVWCEMKFYVYLVRLDKTSDEIQLQANDDLVEFRWIEKDKVLEIELNKPSQELFGRVKI